MAALGAGRRAGKDVFLDVLSNTEESRRRPAGISGDASMREEDEDDDMMAFLEASSSEKENDLLKEIETLKTVESLQAGKKEQVLTQYRSHEELTQVLAHNKVVKANERLQHDYAEKFAAAEDAQNALRIEEGKLRSLKKEAQAGALKDPSRIAFHEREVEKAWARVTHAEKQRDLAELELHNKTAPVLASAMELQRDNLRHEAVAHERQADEVRRAKSQIARHAERVEAAKDHAQALADEEIRLDVEREFHQALGKKRFRQMQAQHRATMDDVEKVREAKHAYDARRVLDLKASVNRINGEVRASNESQRRKKLKTRNEQEQRKQDLLNSGQNPYEVFRREEISGSKDKQQKDFEVKRELRADKLLVQLMEEDRRYRNKIKAEKEKRALIDNFQKEMGNYAREKRVAAYIRKATIGNVAVLDPTGSALRLDPSKVTIQKTHAFGLGHARLEEVQKVEESVESAKRQIAKWSTPVDPDLLPPSPQGQGDGEASPSRPSHFEDPEDQESGRLVVPKLTKLEEQYLAAARERQKQNICTVQRCWGKEFKGDAFLAKPSIISFPDFEVGKSYRQVVEVTNVSLTFNQFKLLPLDDKIKDFFEIEFVPPGRMSAGVTRYITVWFHPKVPTDIATTFPILAKTGRIDFPLRCTTKKTILTITPQDADATPVVDFGQVLDGESGSSCLKIKNAGALSTSYTLKPVDDENPFLSMLSWERSGSFVDLGTSTIKFTFTPALGATGAYEIELKLSMSNGAPGDAKFVEEKRVFVRGRCIDTPLYVEKEEYDLKICLYGHMIRENIILHNRQSVAMKVHVEEPHALEGQLSINPTLAYVQGHKSFTLQVKFSPNDDFLQKCPQYRDSARSDQEGAFRIPIKVVGADQVLPVCTSLLGTLCVDEVSLEPSMLTFGSCLVGFSAVQSLRIINHSLLPQRFAFLKIPGCIKIKDMPSDVLDEETRDPIGWAEGTAVLDGGSKGTFGTLLPKEVRTISVLYSPDAATELQQTVDFKVITGGLAAKVYPVPCRGQGFYSPLKLSHTQIRMCAVPTGVVCRESIEVTNTSNVPQMFNLLVPPTQVAGLSASPVCHMLQPKERARVLIEFKPTAAYVNLFEPPPPPVVEEAEPDAVPVPEKAPAKGAKAKAAAAPPPPEELSEEALAEKAAAEAAAAEKAAAEEAERVRQHGLRMLKEIREHGGRRWEVPADFGGSSVHASWKLAICVQPKVEAKQSKAQSKSSPVMLYLGVDTCVTPTSLAIEPKVLNFGEVTAQQRLVLPVTFTSLNPEVAEHGLHVGSLAEVNCFKVLNAPRPVKSKQFQLMVEFNPAEAQIYESLLQLYSVHDKDQAGLQGPIGQIPLRGKGVRPVLKILPENGILQLGAVIHTKDSDSYVTAQLTVVNDSPFDLNYKLETEVESEKDERRGKPFTLTPSTGIVKGNDQKIVTVTFRPHRPAAMFREKVLVNVPNQKAPTYVYLFGHCFSYQVYAMYDMDFSPFNSSAARVAETAFKGHAAVGTGSATNESGEFAYQSAQEKHFQLEFAKGDRVKCLLVGSCVPPGTPKAPQNTPAQAFDFQIEQSEFSGMFTVEAPEGGGKPDKQVKGQVQAGKAPTRVAFRYNPPSDAALTCGGTTLDLLDGIGQWITVRVKGVLAGGYVPPPNAPNSNQEIVVELKAYLQQI